MMMFRSPSRADDSTTEDASVSGTLPFPKQPEDEEEETTLYRMYRDRRLRRWFVEGVYD